MFLKRFFIIVLITSVVAYATGLIFDHAYKKRWSVLFFEKTDSLIKGTNYYDIIFLGNSRVHFGINPYYVDSVTGLNSYNFGYGGGGIVETMMVSSVYLQQHPAPKVAVISLDMGALTKNQNLESSFHYLFYLKNDIINKYMQDAGFLTPIIQLFPFSKYSFFDEYNRTSLFVKGNAYPVFEHNIYRGFLNVEKKAGSSAAVFSKQEAGEALWNPAIIQLKNLVVSLQKKGCKVVFVSAPEKNTSVYKGTTLRKATDSIFTAVASEYKLSYFHFDTDTTYRDNLFTDDIHLNEPGTRKYSIKLADSIMRIYP
ncbi:MAG: hypothetical protein H7258_00750 [Ferruginibacter sp.]|nr:hypothetical protein [Ferruginibacter sp.]